MSWLKFNDSLNSLKGQITNFANTVLAEDVLENGEENGSKESETKSETEVRGDEFTSEDPWTWSAVESKTDQLKTDETITNLKKKIEELQNENRDLVGSLDQLDQDHLQNTEELVKMKNKLSEELEVVTEKYEILNMKYNKLALAENGYKKKINELKNKCEETTNQNKSQSFKNDDNNYTAKYELLEQENVQLKKNIASLEMAQKKSEIEDYNTKCASLNSVIQELQMENKALKIAIQSTNNSKTTENNENIKKYEDEIENLRNELEHLKNEKLEKESKKATQDRDESVEKVVQETHNKKSEVEKLNDKIILSNEETKIMKEKYEDVINKLQLELKTIKTVKDLEKSENMNQSKEFLTTIKELKEKLHEANLEIIQMKEKYSNLEKNKLDLEESNRENENIAKHHQQQIEDLKKGEMLQKNKIELNEKRSETLETTLKQFNRMFEEQFKDYLGEDEFPYDSDDIQNISEILPNRIKKIHEIVENFQRKLEDMEISLSKTIDIQTKKDEEIEKLLHNSEMLTQELSIKSKEINDMEEECSELMKNNELLISKLNEMKITGLQTIFESNEDNVASMEKQLDDDLKRIEELENLLVQKEIEKKRIDEEIIEETKDNTDLMRNIKQIEEEKQNLQIILDELRDKLSVVETERDNCRIVIDKMRLDFETTEYQFSEMNVNLETLSEEIEKHKMRIDLLLSENENLKSLRQEDSKNDEELKLVKQELTDLKNVNEMLQKELEDNEKNQKLQEREKEETFLKIQNEMDVIMSAKISLEEQIGPYQHENEMLKKVYSFLIEEFLSEQEISDSDEFKISKIMERVNEMKIQSRNLEEERLKLISELEMLQSKIQDSENNDVQTELQKLMESRNELIAIIQTKHQETLTYHGEIQRLSEILKQETEKNIKMETEIESLKMNSCSAETLNAKIEEIEKLREQIDFLRQKCDVLAQSLLEEQQKTENEKLSSTEKEGNLNKKLERLQSHLMEVEEHYTQELLQSEEKIATLQARLNEVEKREKDSSTIYTSVSIRANQQNEALTQQLQSMTTQRDELRKKLLDQEDENNIKSAALSNLQLVLEQFQRDKEADVIRETDRIRRQVKHEQGIQDELRKEIVNLENQIKESKQGLQAALRLTDQLEMSKSQIATLKEEVSVLTDKLHHREEELKMVTSQTDGKVDKSLIKNLIIGFVTSNKNLNKDQKQILKIIATVLDFNEQDHTKVNLNQAQQNTWLNSLLSPVAGSEGLTANESLSRAFVNFLENESKPRIVPSLVHQSSMSESSSSVNSSTRTTPTPIVLNEIVLPTFSDFPQHRNSSSILKGVLKDNS